jgi:hypothetical protein
VKIKIDWITDEYECETCGWNIACGAIVTFENGDKIDMTPTAGCVDPVDYGGDEVYEAIFKKLGHEIEQGSAA